MLPHDVGHPGGRESRGVGGCKETVPYFGGAGATLYATHGSTAVPLELPKKLGPL